MTADHPETPHPQLSLRASDADRETYVAVLREAYAEGRLDADEYEERLDAAYRARTYGELVPLLADLPRMPNAPALPGPSAPAPMPFAGPAVVPAPGASSPAVVAIFGGAERKGTWTVPAELTATAVFGGVEIDLSAAVFAAPVVEIKAVAVFGGVEIRVPVGVHLEVDGIGIFGGFSHKPGGGAAPGAPRVRITGVAFFGGVDVQWVPPAAPAAHQQVPPGPQPPQLPGA